MRTPLLQRRYPSAVAVPPPAPRGRARYPTERYRQCGRLVPRRRRV